MQTGSGKMIGKSHLNKSPKIIGKSISPKERKTFRINIKIDSISWNAVGYSKNPYIRTLNFRGKAAVGSYLNDYKLKYQAVRLLRIFEYMLQSHVSSWGFPSTL